jgi:hypothetical protein
MTSLVLGIEQIVGLVQILDEHKQPVSVVARLPKSRRIFRYVAFSERLVVMNDRKVTVKGHQKDC